VDRQPYPAWGKPLGVVVLVLTAFAAGGLAERAGWLPGGAGEPPAARDTFRPFWQAWRLTQEHYVDREAVQPERMMRGALRGMLASLGDVGHTTYLTPEQRRELQEGIKGEFVGIGAHMTVRKRLPTVLSVIPNSPAQAAGLKAGDVFLEVDRKPVSDLSLDQIARLVRGPAGTTVKLRVLRKGHTEPIPLSIPRGKVEVPSVIWRMLPGEAVAHVAILNFGLHTDAELRAALKGLRARGARGLLLDLRGNPGGLKEQAVAVTSEFLKDGVVFIEQDARGRRTPVQVVPGGRATDLPLVVLIDEGTASAAEILAGALQDHSRGKLVGTRTFGTGTVLQPFPLSDGAAVLLAVAQWLTPTGRQIWHKGITPDETVALPQGAAVLLPEMEPDLTAADLARSEDRQLLRGLELLKKGLR
jgi:carboxyl-terminal processing protease